MKGNTKLLYFYAITFVAFTVKEMIEGKWASSFVYSGMVLVTFLLLRLEKSKKGSE